MDAWSQAPTGTKSPLKYINGRKIIEECGTGCNTNNQTSTKDNDMLPGVARSYCVAFAYEYQFCAIMQL